MKTTLELPDDLLRRIKLRAVERNQKLKDAMAQLLEAGIASEPRSVAALRAPKPVRLRKRGPLSLKDIETAISGGRD